MNWPSFVDRLLRRCCSFAARQSIFHIITSRKPPTTPPHRPSQPSPLLSPLHPHSPISRIMVALHRDAPHRDAALSDCCAKTLIQHLAFDPELQDRVWYSTRASRRNPPLRCSGYPKAACDLQKLLDTIGFDPVAQTVSWQTSREPPYRNLQLGALVTSLSLSTSRMLKSPTLAPAPPTVRLDPSPPSENLLTHAANTVFTQKPSLAWSSTQSTRKFSCLQTLALTFEPRADIHPVCEFPAEPSPCEQSSDGRLIVFG